MFIVVTDHKSCWTLWVCFSHEEVGVHSIVNSLDHNSFNVTDDDRWTETRQERRRRLEV